MVGDPLTNLLGEKILFWVPTDVVVKLLVVGDKAIYGMARPSRLIGSSNASLRPSKCKDATLLACRSSYCEMMLGSKARSP